jgi:hypothetical protein
VLRLDDLRTSNGPDLFVRGLRRDRSVVIWCRRFTYAFGVAPLMLR